ncbi:MAG: MMCAP2_0565 family pilin-like conjugal transfer protein [Patescibacteria group bacterium]
MITGWTNFLLPFVGAIAIAAIVYAGFLYLTAAGNQEQTEKAKKIIIWVVIGIIVIVSAYAIVNTVLSGKSAVQSDNQVDISIGGTDINVGW